MVDAAINHTAVEVKAPEGRPSDYFGKRVFGRAAMRKYLNKATYDALVDTMENGTPLTREVADGIAAGMRQWALEHGADHYTHWFQPLTGGVLRQTARPAGARCVVVPQRRHPQYVRGSRLFGLGSDLAGLHRRHDALYPDRLHRLYGRGARLQGAAAALDLGGEQGRDRGVPLFRQKRAAGHLVSGLGAGVFPRGRKPLGRTSRPDAHRAYADGT